MVVGSFSNGYSALTKHIQDQVSLTLTVSNSIATSTSDVVTPLDEVLRRQEQTERLMQTMIRFQQTQNETVSLISTVILPRLRVEDRLCVED